MTKREQLRRLRRITAGEKRQPPEHPNHDQIQQSNRHWPRSCPTRTSHETAAQGHCAGSGTVQVKAVDWLDCGSSVYFLARDGLAWQTVLRLPADDLAAVEQP
jgi:hypothetical protein